MEKLAKPCCLCVSSAACLTTSGHVCSKKSGYHRRTDNLYSFRLMMVSVGQKRSNLLNSRPRLSTGRVSSNALS